jgi:hypothetical protein
MSPLQPQINLDAMDAASQRLERHSYINLINVVHAELQLIERMIDAPGALRDSIRLAEAASRAFKDRESAEQYAGPFSTFASDIQGTVEQLLSNSGEPGRSADVMEAVEILQSVLADAQCRINEVLTRHEVNRPVEDLSIECLQNEISKITGEQVAVHGESWSAPVGFSRAIEDLLIKAFARAPSSTRIRGIVLTHDSGVTQITVNGHIDTEPFDPLTGNLRPSELYELIRAGHAILRPALELYYFCRPEGNLTLNGTQVLLRATLRGKSDAAAGVGAPS